jgi:hypothetical protein
MLTSEAYAERMWGHFPALRRVLEDKNLKSPHWSASVDEPLRERLARFSYVAELALEHKADVRDAAQSVGSDEVHADITRLARDIERLAREVERVANSLAHLWYDVRELQEFVERPDTPQSPE